MGAVTALVWTFVIWLVAFIAYGLELRFRTDRSEPQAILFADMLIAVVATVVVWLIWGFS